MFSQRSLRGCTFLRANRKIRHCVATAWLRQARREKCCLFLFCKVCPHVFGAAVRFSFLCDVRSFFKGKSVFTVAVFFAVQPGFCGASSSVCPHGLGSRRELLGAPKSPAALGSALLQRNGEGIRTFSLGARKGVSPRRHTVFSSFLVPLASLWSRQIPGRYFGRKSV